MSTFHKKLTLPTQSKFLETGLIPSRAPSGTRCSICADDCISNEGIVKILHDNWRNCKPARTSACYFHKECIMAWFTSTCPQRGTCPNDRIELFKPDHLTTQQISTLDEDISGLEFNHPLLLLARQELYDFGQVQYDDMAWYEIIEAWHSSGEARTRLEAIGRHLRDSHNQLDELGLDLVEEMLDLGDLIGEVVDEAKDRYIEAAKYEFELIIHNVEYELETIRKLYAELPEVGDIDRRIQLLRSTWSVASLGDYPSHIQSLQSLGLETDVLSCKLYEEESMRLGQSEKRSEVEREVDEFLDSLDLFN